MITKLEIDELAQKYETIDFIKDDPVQFPHKFNKTKEDCEISGFIASLLAYGNRKVFIKKLNELFDIAENEPYNFILNFLSVLWQIPAAEFKDKRKGFIRSAKPIVIDVAVAP